MKNLKIRVANEAESKEAQELFFELGYGWHGKGKLVSHLDEISSDGFGWLVLWKPPYLINNVIQLGSGSEDCKEITIQELRDMVNPMREYLEKQVDGSYKLVMRGIVGRDDDIEIPEGADCARSTSDGLEFYKDNLNLFFSISGDCWKNTISSRGALSQNIVWQRHTQPEESPFMESLNDQYAEIEQVRKQTIEATLAERQAQYGCFEDVAFVTENIMAVLSKVRTNGLNDLPHTHRMALYMIASKMARIVNGDFNHKDSWHDIGGYSKLIEDLL